MRFLQLGKLPQLLPWLALCLMVSFSATLFVVFWQLVLTVPSHRQLAPVEQNTSVVLQAALPSH